MSALGFASSVGRSRLWISSRGQPSWKLRHRPASRSLLKSPELRLGQPAGSLPTSRNTRASLTGSSRTTPFLRPPPDSEPAGAGAGGAAASNRRPETPARASKSAGKPAERSDDAIRAAHIGGRYVIAGAVIAAVGAVVGAVLAAIFTNGFGLLPAKAHGAGTAQPASPPGPHRTSAASSYTGRASRGRTVTSFPAPGTSPSALAFDGKDFWVADSSSDNFFQIDVNGQIDTSYHSPGSSPEGITWDGRSFWLFAADQGRIVHFRINNGQVETLGRIVSHAQCGGWITCNLAWDHGDLWLAEADQFNVKLLSVKGAVVRQITKGSEVRGLAWD